MLTDISDICSTAQALLGAVLVGGPSSIGKTTLINMLIKLFPERYVRPASFTSRQRRNSDDDNEYIFVSKEQMVELNTAGDLLNFDEVYGNFYGISRESILKILAGGRVPIKEVHPSNHDKIRSLLPSTLSLILVPAQNTDDDRGIRFADNPNSRDEQDRLYYSQLDLSQYDIVYRLDRNNPIESVAHLADAMITTLFETSNRFPRGPVIDDINRLGYEMVAEEFTDDRRPTTQNFHQLSEVFFAAVLAEHITHGENCLEVGPGQGWLRSSFMWPDVEYSAVDISASMALHNPENVLCVSARILPFPTGSFDNVIASLADPFCYPGALLEINRVLRAGGKFIFTAPCRTWSDAIRNPEDRDATSFLLSDGIQARVSSFTFHAAELVTLLNACGYNVLRGETIGGSLLASETSISPVLERAAESLVLEVSDLPVLNALVAVKRGK